MIFGAFVTQLAITMELSTSAFCWTRSPAIDAGDPSSFPAADQQGVHRRQIGGPDIGAFELTPVIPAEGTIGTEIFILGAGGFGEKKGKVLLGSLSLTIMEWTEKLIQTRIPRSLSPNIYDLTIQPKGVPPLSGGSFEVAGPEIESTDPGHGASGDEITLAGKFFGTKKGKVTLGGKNCRVLSWTMNPSTGESNIRFVVPTKLDPGTDDLKVIVNGVGEDTISFTVD